MKSSLSPLSLSLLLGVTVFLNAGFYFEPPKVRIKDVKPLDAKAIEEQSIKDHEGSSQLDPKLYDNRGFEVTVDCMKERGLTLEMRWLVSQMDDPKTQHEWIWSRNRAPVEPDSKGIATVRTSVFHFAKDIPKVLARETSVYVFEGWAIYVIDANNHQIAYKTSSAAVEKSLKDWNEAHKNDKPES